MEYRERVAEAIENTNFDEYDVYDGDCVCIAAAVNAVFGGVYVASYAHEADIPKKPAHIAIQIDGQLYDGGGQTNEEALRDRAFGGGLGEFDDVVVVDLPSLPFKGDMNEVPEVKTVVTHLKENRPSK